MLDNIMASPSAEMEYIRGIAERVWKDGIRSGRPKEDTDWYLLYMQGFQRMLKEEAYKLMEREENHV